MAIIYYNITFYLVRLTGTGQFELRPVKADSSAQKTNTKCPVTRENQEGRGFAGAIYAPGLA
jgi:hypothetical protein